MLGSLGKDDPLLHPTVVDSHFFPGVWRYMMPPEFLSMNFPSERRSSCMNCPKVCYEGYRNDFRCCTYHPRIPNFLLGLAAMKNSAGAHLLKELIRKGLVTPEGTNSSPRQWYGYLADIEHDRFGKNSQTRCPALDEQSGLCRIHAFRNAVCSTFFCIKDHGSKGDVFWERVQSLVSQTETALSQWALQEVGFDLDGYIKKLNDAASTIDLLSAKGEFGWTKTALKIMWGDWYGREFELVIHTAEKISQYREELWDIANSHPIREATLFDRAMIKAVPRSLKDQVEDSDLEDSQESYLPWELWQDCYRSYRGLQRPIYGRYRLHRTAQLLQNPGASKEHRYHQMRQETWILGRKRHIEQSDWNRCLFLSEDEKVVVEAFVENDSVVVDWKFFESFQKKGPDNPKSLVQELLHQKFIVRIDNVQN